MMTSDNYSTPRKYKVDASDGYIYHKDNDRKETKSLLDDHVTKPSDSTDLCAESADVESPLSSNGRRNRHRRSKDHVSEDFPQKSEDVQLEGATAQVSDKPKSLKKEKASGKKRKDRKNLREKRRSTGVVIMPGAGAATDDQESEARQTLENTKQNESIGAEDFTPSPREKSSSNPGRSSRIAHDDVDLDRQDKQDLIDRLEQLERSLDQKTKEVETLKSENQRLREENNALLRVVNQVSSLKTK